MKGLPDLEVRRFVEGAGADGPLGLPQALDSKVSFQEIE